MSPERARAEAPAPPNEPATAALYFTLLGGGVAWSAQLLVDYVLVGIRCKSGADVFSWGVTVFSILMALVTLWALLVGVRVFRATGLSIDAEDPTSPSLGRAALMAIGGIAFDSVFLVLIIVSTTPNLFMDPCLRIG